MDLEQRASDEKKKWEKPYKYEPFPQMLYRGLPVKPGWEHCTVGSEQEKQDKLDNGQGWKEDLAEAIEYQAKLAADIGVAAAERAASDRKMSAKAQAEALAAEEAADGHHIGEVPEAPRPPKGRLKKTLSASDHPKEE